MSNKELSISNVSIRQDHKGHYCLNDLHVASGKHSRHQASKFLITQQAIDLVDLIESEQSITGIPVSEQKQAVIVIKGGNSLQGTFAVKEIVYAYAMWISPKFHLAVIRAYDAMVTGQPLPNALKSIPKQKALPQQTKKEILEPQCTSLTNLVRNSRYTITGLAKKIGVHRQSIHGWMIGNSAIPEDKAIALAKIFNIAPETIRYGISVFNHDDLQLVLCSVKEELHNMGIELSPKKEGMLASMLYSEIEVFRGHSLGDFARSRIKDRINSYLRFLA